MGGEFAVLFLIVALFSGEAQWGNLTISRYDAEDRTSISAGNLFYQEDNVGYEAYITQNYAETQFKPFYGTFNPFLGLSVTDAGGVWGGFGLYQQLDFEIGDQTFFAGISVAPGLYFRGEEIDLGFILEYRSALEIGMRFDNDWQLSLMYDHRSNGGVSEINHGMETFQLRFSKNFN